MWSGRHNKMGGHFCRFFGTCPPKPTKPHRNPPKPTGFRKRAWRWVLVGISGVEVKLHHFCTEFLVQGWATKGDPKATQLKGKRICGRLSARNFSLSLQKLTKE